MLVHAKKLKNFNFFGAKRMNLQHLYTLAKILRVSYQRCECFIKKQCLKFLLLAFMKLASFVLYSV